MMLMFIIRVFYFSLVFVYYPSFAQISKPNDNEIIYFSNQMDAHSDVLDTEYIVRLRPQSTSLRSEVGINAQVESLFSHIGISNPHVLNVYSKAFSGFAIRGISKLFLRRLQRSKLVESVSPNIKVYASATQNNPKWNLDRIDQLTYPLSNTYSYKSMGTNVKVFILDTGIRLDHSEFKNSIGKSRAKCGFTAFSNCTDYHGHGTHVAAIVGGLQYGVAKNVDLIAVKVLGDNGVGSLSSVLAGIEYVLSQRSSTRKTPPPMVINMSLGSSYNALLNDAVKKATESGIIVVVAAANDASDACNYSPASEPTVLTVGATEQNQNGIDTYDYIASYSNQGTCVDIFAPGSNIVSASHYCLSCSVALSGTSMATPHVVGVAAQFLQLNSTATPAMVWAAIRERATLNNLAGISSASPNVFLQTNL